MAFPIGWPPRPPSGRRSIRFYVTDTATANFSDKAYLFSDGVGANPYTPLPYIPPGGGASPTIVVPPSPWGSGQNPKDADTSKSVAADQAVPHNMIWAFGITICVDGGADLEYSFDGVNVAGKVKAADGPHTYTYRHEAGICVRGATSVFRIMAW